MKVKWSTENIEPEMIPDKTFITFLMNWLTFYRRKSATSICTVFAYLLF